PRALSYRHLRHRGFLYCGAGIDHRALGEKGFEGLGIGRYWVFSTGYSVQSI
ncbi:MAG: hypothetical protein ACJAVY_002524, partial [Marinoscillum sp.]